MKKLSHSAYIQKLLTEFVDLIFPPSREEKLLRGAQKTTLRSLNHPGVFNNIKYLCRYSEPIVKTAITENKFNNNHTAAKVLGIILQNQVDNLSGEILFIPVPLGKKRLRQRGHNQVETIIRAVTPPITMCSSILKRRIETLPQSQLNKTDREKNMRDVFYFTGDNFDMSKYSQIILIDDVVTTGATLHEARATLAPHVPPNVRLTCLAIAH